MDVLRLTLFLGLIAICVSRKLNDKDKEKLMELTPKWKTPPIDEFLEGTVTKSGNLKTYKIKYKNEDSGRICDVTYKEKKLKAGGLEGTHKWKCTVLPPTIPDDPMLSSEVSSESSSSEE